MAEVSGEIQESDVCLEVKTWSVAYGAVHFYAKLKPFVGEPVILTRQLSAKEAGILNKRHGCKPGGIGAYREGQTYEGFDSVQSAIDKALQVWEAHFPHAERLVWARTYWPEHEGVLAVRSERRSSL